jgi:GxxExxY protein
MNSEGILFGAKDTLARNGNCMRSMAMNGADGSAPPNEKLFPEESVRCAGGLEKGELTHRIIAAGIEVLRALGPGFVESVYENALVLELESRGLKVERQVAFDVFYKGEAVGNHRLDLLFDGTIVVELKAVKAFEPVHFAIVKSYLATLGLKHGLLLNFAATRLQVRRVQQVDSAEAKRSETADGLSEPRKAMEGGA